MSNCPYNLYKADERESSLEGGTKRRFDVGMSEMELFIGDQ